ncbi:MAG TPA: 4-hydroxy-tetrahydrodipicolinate reductase [Candidatus Cloacimonadota bacterium]|nr:4-hydroxy-tetrahydrodipicolinate reductase [Candidatus Cloacimonadota bacterium]
MPKIAIVGYGQMGKLIEKLAPENGFQVCAIIDPLLGNDLSDPVLQDADVCVEFSSPQAVRSNLRSLIELKKQIVCGTTGWQEHLPEILELVTKNGTGFVYGSNFSFGMNLFYEIVAHATQLMNSAENYDPYGLEMHHHRKKDSPSGTAKILSDMVLQNIERKTQSQYEKLDRQIRPEEFHFASIRAGEIPGTHLIGFDSDADNIELKHTARNRNGLALGALKAAHWIIGKKGSYDFSGIFREILKG